MGRPPPPTAFEPDSAFDSNPQRTEGDPAGRPETPRTAGAEVGAGELCRPRDYADARPAHPPPVRDPASSRGSCSSTPAPCSPASGPSPPLAGDGPSVLERPQPTHGSLASAVRSFLLALPTLMLVLVASNVARHSGLDRAYFASPAAGQSGRRAAWLATPPHLLCSPELALLYAPLRLPIRWAINHWFNEDLQPLPHIVLISRSGALVAS